MRKVLIILESEDCRLALQEALQDRFDVLSYSDATAGAEMLQRRPDALIMDLLLPEIDAISFLMRHRDFRPAVILMLTTYISSDILQAASDLDIDHIIRKPCSITAITKHLIDCLT